MWEVRTSHWYVGRLIIKDTWRFSSKEEAEVFRATLHESSELYEVEDSSEDAENK